MQRPRWASGLQVVTDNPPANFCVAVVGYGPISVAPLSVVAPVVFQRDAIRWVGYDEARSQRRQDLPAVTVIDRRVSVAVIFTH